MIKRFAMIFLMIICIYGCEESQDVKMSEDINIENETIVSRPAGYTNGYNIKGVNRIANKNKSRNNFNTDALEIDNPESDVSVDDLLSDNPELEETDNPESDISTDPDNVEMAYIPAGEYVMGGFPGYENSNDPNIVHFKKTPKHAVYIDAFYIDVHEVTIEQFSNFITATDYSGISREELEGKIDRGFPNGHNRSSYGPIEQFPALVSWNDATAYAEWAGKRLPTEAEWEKAARDGLHQAAYPWGDSAPTAESGNFYYSTGAIVYSAYDAIPEMVMRYEPTTNYGLYDMVGNVGEWCQDAFHPDAYENHDYVNPVQLFEDPAYEYPAQKEWNPPLTASFINMRVARGSGWHSIYRNVAGMDSNSRLRLRYDRIHIAIRHYARRDEIGGFRCVKNSE